MEHRVLCYAMGHDEGRWEAICVDLDIAVEGTSFRNVQSRLESAIRSYVEEALKEEPHIAQKLLNRRSPLRVRLRLWAATQLFQLRRRSTEARSAATFEVPCPA